MSYDKNGQINNLWRRERSIPWPLDCEFFFFKFLCDPMTRKLLDTKAHVAPKVSFLCVTLLGWVFFLLYLATSLRMHFAAVSNFLIVKSFSFIFLVIPSFSISLFSSFTILFLWTLLNLRWVPLLRDLIQVSHPYMQLLVQSPFLASHLLPPCRYHFMLIGLYFFKICNIIYFVLSTCL